MKEISLSTEAQQLTQRLQKLHDAGKVFHRDGTLRRGPELDRIVRDTIVALGRLVKRHAKLRGTVCVSGQVLFNFGILVRSCHGCVCHYGMYMDNACYYLGSGSDPACVEA